MQSNVLVPPFLRVVVPVSQEFRTVLSIAPHSNVSTSLEPFAQRGSAMFQRAPSHSQLFDPEIGKASMRGLSQELKVVLLPTHQVHAFSKAAVAVATSTEPVPVW